MPRLGKGKPMDVQANAVLKSFLDLSSRHAAKLAGDVKGSQATGKIHSLRTFEKYTDSVKLAGEWGREHAGIRHLRDMTPELAQAYLEDRAAQGIGQKTARRRPQRAAIHHRPGHPRAAAHAHAGRTKLARVHAGAGPSDRRSAK